MNLYWKREVSFPVCHVHLKLLFFAYTYLIDKITIKFFIMNTTTLAEIGHNWTLKIYYFKQQCALVGSIYFVL